MPRRSFTAKVCSHELKLFLYDLIKYMQPASSLVIVFSRGRLLSIRKSDYPFVKKVVIG